MANLSAIHYLGTSVIDHLRRAYPKALSDAESCTFTLYSTGFLQDSPPSDGTTMTLIPYNITLNEHSRTANRLAGPAIGTVPLGVDVYFLLTVWTTSTFAEQSIMGWAMRELYINGTLDRSMLDPKGGWDVADRIQITPSDLRIEDLIRIWEGLRQPFRLSVGYMARVVQIDVPPEPDHAPVVATRFGYHDWDYGERLEDSAP
ncbi:MAG: DUF4255 domain-containing protein [Anaerolineae bacterium]|nr:DUF4255 domain-containing protein [Anaerolineae bacterium]